MKPIRKVNIKVELYFPIGYKNLENLFNTAEFEKSHIYGAEYISVSFGITRFKIDFNDVIKLSNGSNVSLSE